MICSRCNDTGWYYKPYTQEEMSGNWWREASGTQKLVCLHSDYYELWLRASRAVDDAFERNKI